MAGGTLVATLGIVPSHTGRKVLPAVGRIQLQHETVAISWPGVAVCQY